MAFRNLPQKATFQETQNMATFQKTQNNLGQFSTKKKSKDGHQSKKFTLAASTFQPTSPAAVPVKGKL